MSVEGRVGRVARGAVLVLAAFSVSLLPGPVMPTHAAEADEHTQWNLMGEEGDYIVGPTTYSYDADDDIEVTGGREGVSADVRTAHDWWTLWIYPPQGQLLEAGRSYVGATRWPFSEPDEPGLSLHGSGRGCNELSGWFTVNEIEVDEQGDVTAFNVSFEQRCEHIQRAAYGALAWNSSLPTDALPPDDPDPPNPDEHTEWNLMGEEGDFIVGPAKHSYAGDDIRVTGGRNGISADVFVGTPHYWTLWIYPPQGELLEAGRTYVGATRWPFSERDEPGLSLHGAGRGCNNVSGWFTVNEIKANQKGDVTAFNVTFEQHCEHVQAAAYGALAWNSSMPTDALPPPDPPDQPDVPNPPDPTDPPDPPSLSLKASSTKLVFGETVELRAQLTAAPGDSTVSIYQKVGNGHRTLVATGATDSDGFFRHSITPRASARYWAIYRGPDHVPDASASARVAVQPLLQTRVTAASGKQGRYHLIARGKRAYFLARVRPKSPKACLAFRAQFLVGGRWGYDGVVRCVRLSKRSVAGVYFDWNTQLAGVPIRVRAEWKGDRASLRQRSAWSYLRMVKGRVAASGTAPYSVPGTVAVPLSRL